MNLQKPSFRLPIVLLALTACVCFVGVAQTMQAAGETAAPAVAVTPVEQSDSSARRRRNRVR